MQSDIQVFVTKPLNRAVRLILFDSEGLELQSVETVFEKVAALRHFVFEETGLLVLAKSSTLTLDYRTATGETLIVSHLELRKTNPLILFGQMGGLLDKLL